MSEEKKGNWGGIGGKKWLSGLDSSSQLTAGASGGILRQG